MSDVLTDFYAFVVDDFLYGVLGEGCSFLGFEVGGAYAPLIESMPVTCCEQFDCFLFGCDPGGWVISCFYF